MLDPHPNQVPKPDPEPKCITEPVSQRQKLAVSVVSGSKILVATCIFVSYQRNLHVLQELKVVTQI
jgi:hypothetical protein